jgi:predicted nucleic acid-binding protein
MLYLTLLKKREPYFSDSYNIFLKSATREFEAIIGASSVTDIYYITRKNCKNSKQALSFIIYLLEVVNFVDTKAVDIQEAIRLNFSDFEDAVVAATVSREKASYIITRNAKDFSKSNVPAISPANFLKKYNT